MQATMETGIRFRCAVRQLTRPLLALSLSAALGVPAVAGPPPATGVPAYRIIHLSPDVNASGYINASGQVAFTEAAGTGFRSRFYDGRRILDIGTLRYPDTRVGGLNDHGQVVGSSLISVEPQVTHSFIWHRATGIRDLHPAGQNSLTSAAVAINNRGQVAGVGNQAFFWSRATGVLPLATLGADVFPTAINERGVIVGGAYLTEPGQGQKFLPARWTAPSRVEILSDSDLPAEPARDINASGQVVGAIGLPDTPFSVAEAYVWTAEQGLVRLPSVYESGATRINDAGTAIGFARGQFSHGAIWRPGQGMVEIGEGQAFPTSARDLNKHGQVVGAYNDRAYVWTAVAGVVDLNNRIPGAPDELVLTQASAISDDGSILANANTGLVLLVPRPGYDHPPLPGPITVTGAPRAGAVLSFSANFIDHDRDDTHWATWDWGDGSSSAGIVGSRYGVGNVSGQKVYPGAGTHTVTLTIVDSAGNRSSVKKTVAVRAAGGG